MRVTFGSVSDLAEALRAAEHAHGEYEAQLGRRDEDWPTWYAEYIMRTYGTAEPGEPEAQPS